MPKARKVEWTNKDGSIGAAWAVRYRDESGKRRYKQFDRKKDADGFGNTITTEVREGRHVHDRDTITVAEGADLWLEACKRGRDGREPVEPSTLRMYDQHVRLHIKPLIGGLKFSHLTPLRVKAFRDHDMLEKGGRSRKMTKKVLASLSAICSELQGEGLLPKNPCDGITISTAGRHKQQVTIPTKAEVVAVVDRAREWIEAPPKAEAMRGGTVKQVQDRISRDRALWFYTMVKFIVGTGVRLSEARGAARAALSLRKGIYAVGQRADERGILGPPKSGSGFRELELSPGLVRDIEEWLKVAPADAELLFGNGKDKPEGMSNIYGRFWLPLLVELGFATRTVDAAGRVKHETRFGIHDLRHFHASLQIEGGMQPKQLQEHMGHSSIQVTMDTYGHLFKDDEARAKRRAIIVGAVDGLLSPGEACVELR